MKREINNPNIVLSTIGNDRVGGFVAFRPSPRAHMALDFTFDMNCFLVLGVDKNWVPVALEIMDLNKRFSPCARPQRQISQQEAIEGLYDIAFDLAQLVREQTERHAFGDMLKRGQEFVEDVFRTIKTFGSNCQPSLT